MPQFPKYRPQKKMTTAGGPQRMGNIGGSGLESVGRVVGQAGQVLQGINREIINAERTANVNKAEAQLTEAMANARARLQTMNEATLANFTEDGEVMLGEEGESLIESLDELKVDGIGGDRVEEVIERSKSQLRGMAKGQFLRMRASRMNSEALANYSTAIDNGNPAKAKQFLENSHEAGILSTETYNEKMAEFPARAQFNFVRDAIANGQIEDVESVRKNPGKVVQEMGGGEDWQMGVGYQDVMAGGWHMNDEQWADLETYSERAQREKMTERKKEWNANELELIQQDIDGELTIGTLQKWSRQGLIDPRWARREILKKKKQKGIASRAENAELEEDLSQAEISRQWSELEGTVESLVRGEIDMNEHKLTDLESDIDALANHTSASTVISLRRRVRDYRSGINQMENWSTQQKDIFSDLEKRLANLLDEKVKFWGGEERGMVKRVFDDADMIQVKSIVREWMTNNPDADDEKLRQFVSRMVAPLEAEREKMRLQYEHLRIRAGMSTREEETIDKLESKANQEEIEAEAAALESVMPGFIPGVSY